MKNFLLFLIPTIAFSNSLRSQLIPGDVNKSINEVYALAPGNFSSYGTPTFAITPATTCGGKAVLTVTWGTGASVRYVDLHGGLTYSNTVLTLGNSKILRSANLFRDTFQLPMGVYSIGVYSDPYDDFVGNTGGTGLGVDSTISGGIAYANDQNRAGVFGVTLLPVNTNNLSTCTISNTNATNCTTANGTITISGLAANTNYQVANLVNVVFSGNINSGASGSITISSLLTGIYPVKIRRSGETCYRQFNIKVGNNSGIECFADNQLIDASFGTNLINGGDFGVATGRLPRNIANTPGTGTTDYAAVTFNTSDPQDSRYALEDTTNLRANGFGSNTYTWRLRKFQFPTQYSHLWATMQRTGDHTGSFNQNSGNTAAGLGYMMLVNANYNSDRVLDISSISLTQGRSYLYSFWGKNIQPFMAKNKNNSASLSNTYQPIIPRLALAVNGIIYDFADMQAVLEPASYTGADTALIRMGWEEYNLRFVAPVTNPSSNITIYNFQTGGFGNDFAIDDIQFLALSVIGDRVWNDLDRDGRQDLNEPGMANITVALLDANSKILQTTISDAFGYYQFANIAPAAGGTTYKVKYFLPAGYTFTTKSTATFDTDSDADATTGVTDPFTMATNDSKVDIDCGLIFDQPFLPSSIGNIIWFDTDGDGVQDNNESGLANITVVLYNSAGNVVTSTVTNASGFYRFDNVTPGNYRVGITQPPGTVCTTKDVTSDDMDSDINTSGINIRKTDLITVAANTQINTVDIGIKLMPTTSSSFGDLCWIDVDADGIQDTTAVGFEPGLPGVKVVLLTHGADNIMNNADDVRVDSMYTDVFGKWQFTNITGSRYYVIFTPPSGYSYTLKDVGTDETIDSDILSPGISGPIFINNSPYGFNYEVLDVGFTVTPPVINAATIGDIFWNDINGDGLQQTGEFGVPGITVELLNNLGTVVAKTTTTLDGFYRFTDVVPANYYIKFSNIPPGYQISLKDQGGDDTQDSDIDIATGISNIFTVANNDIITHIDGAIRQVLFTGNSSVGSYIWYDLDGDGIQDVNETGVPNLLVNLRNAGPDGVMLTGDDITNSTTTNALGQFMFNALPQGQYRVEFVGITNSYFLSPKDAGTDENKDSDGNPLSLTVSLTDNFRLLFGEDRVNVGLGIIPKVNINIIGNRVWLDVNGNGLQDGVELNGVQSVVVQLLDGSGNLIDSDAGTAGIQPYQTVSNAQGYWHIVDLPNATYIPRFSFLPPGFRLSATKVGSDNLIDSDVQGNGRSITSVTLGGANIKDYNNDLGLIPQSTVVGDFVWDDQNGDGIQGATEPGIVSSTATIYNTAGVALGSAVTDGNGKYYFPNVPLGTYYLTYANYPIGMQYTTQETNPYATNGSNVNPTTQRTNNYTISTYGDTLHIDVGLRVVNTANVGNFVWADVDSDGIQDATEKPLAGITVILKNAGLDGIAGNADDFELGTTLTDGNGYYQFIITPTGNNYYLQFGNKPSGSGFTLQNVGGIGATNNSKANPATGITATFNLAYGATNQIQDAGITNISILNVDYEFFTAEKNNNGALLNWALSNPIEISRYEVLHSTDGYSFTKIAVLPGNFNNTNLNYLHTGVVTGNNFYKIATFDASGRLIFSDIKVVKYGEAKTIAIYPNPAAEKLFVKLAANTNLQNTTYSIIDFNGKTSLKGNMNNNVANSGIDINSLATGSYVIMIVENEKLILKESFIKK
jgi:hypothetical protein